MALSKPASNDSADHGSSAWLAWVEDWSIHAVHCWGDHLQMGCRELQGAADRFKVTEPLVELSDDLVDFSFSLGRSIASPLVDLTGASCLGRQDVLMLSSRKTLACNSSSGCSSILSSRKEVSWGKDGTVLSLLIAGVLCPTPSGFLVLASVGPAFSLKAACAFVGTSMLWKCWMVYTRCDDGVTEQNKHRKDLAIAVSGICGIVNLSLAFGGLPALLKLGGITAPLVGLHLSHYVVHPDIFIHYLADVVLNPLLILNMANSPHVKHLEKGGTNHAVSLMWPSMAASALGACCMVGTSLAISPFLVYSCMGANACCVIFQHWDFDVLLKRSRAKKITDAYVFTQMLYTVPTLLAVAMPSKSAVAFLPMIDLFGKMGVLQLTQNDAERPLAQAD